MDVDQYINPRQPSLAATTHDIVGRSLTAGDCVIFVTPWIPTANSHCPTSTHTKSSVQRIRRLLPHHPTDFPCLAISRGHIKRCILPTARFFIAARYGVALGPGQLSVIKPLIRMDDLTSKSGALSCHQEKRSVLDMQDFDWLQNDITLSHDYNLHQ